MRIFDFITKSRSKRKEEKERLEQEKKQNQLDREKFDENLEKKIVESEAKLENLKQQFITYSPIDSTGLVQKRTQLDRIRPHKLEIEVSDGGMASTYNAKVVDSFYIQWKQGRTTFKKIISTPPKKYERALIPIIWWKRGLKYYIKKGAEATHDPDASAFDLAQAKFVMKLVEAIAKAETFQEIAKATRGHDRKQQLIFVAGMVIIAIAGIAGTGEYFK